MIRCSAVLSTGSCGKGSWAPTAERERERESAVLFKQPEFGNDNWIYWGESVCCITAEQSDVDTVCEVNSAFPSILHTSNHGNCTQDLEDIKIKRCMTKMRLKMWLLQMSLVFDD